MLLMLTGGSRPTLTAAPTQLGIQLLKKKLTGRKDLTESTFVKNVFPEIVRVVHQRTALSRVKIKPELREPSPAPSSGLKTQLKQKAAIYICRHRHLPPNCRHAGIVARFTQIFCNPGRFFGIFVYFSF